MATEKSPSYLSSIKEVSEETKSFKNENEIKKISNLTQKAFRLAFRRDYESALEIFKEIENEEMVVIIQKCMDLQPLFDQFVTGQISYAQYIKSSRNYPEEAKEIVQYKYPDLKFIEVKNLEKKFREKIEGIIDDLLTKNTLESLIEARKIFEKHTDVIKKPYNFDKLFTKYISQIPYSNFEHLYFIEWTNVDKLINEFLLSEANSFTKSEKIIKEIKVIEKNRDTIQIIIRKFNKDLDIRLRQNYREAKLKYFVREYKTHNFYFLDRKNKIMTKVEPFFLQRRIYAIYYVNENCEMFLEMLKKHIDTMHVIPFENQRTYYHAIIRAIRITRDYSIFDLFPEEILHSENFTDVIGDTLEEDEVTIRGIVKQLKGKENQAFMEELFLNKFKKELTFIDTKDAPSFNKENSNILINKYKENERIAHKTRVKKVLCKILAAVELILSALIAIALAAICSFAFKKAMYFLGVVLLIAGLVSGIWVFVKLEDIISLKKQIRLFNVKRVLDNIETENNIILRKVYLGLD